MSDGKVEEFEQKAEEARQAGEELSHVELEAQAGDNPARPRGDVLVDANGRAR